MARRLTAEEKGKGIDTGGLEPTPPPPPTRGAEQPLRGRGSRDFRERVDRHGRSFGERISTRFTRNPPPVQNQPLLSPTRRRSGVAPYQQTEYTSPPYAKSRRHHPYETPHRRSLFPPREMKEWRRKTTVEVEQEVNSPNPIPIPEQPVTTPAPEIHESMGTERQQQRERIMEDINRATQMYLNCDDPTEAAARRLRVLSSETRGQVEETVNMMMTERAYPTLTRNQGIIGSNSGQDKTREVVMEELHDTTLQYMSCADPTEARARQLRVLEGDARGEMETVATGILAASRVPQIAPHQQLIDHSDDNHTIQPENEMAHRELMLAPTCSWEPAQGKGLSLL
ncbi:unnamed protein product [Eruca vesicaria subsp. sativa]|uniref:Uncharacterized protein n=1 Tax=Eruca vesicaria subsp. sativa TaxID=29727 RepID=A0ABC8KV19_ERUVS|nr:unnamed protein product [Eruca vesicaria subsp. sativa]